MGMVLTPQPEGWGMGRNIDAPAFRRGSSTNSSIMGASLAVARRRAGLKPCTR